MLKTIEEQGRRLEIERWTSEWDRAETRYTLHMFEGLRIIRYDDREAETDFGPRGQLNRVVRLAAQKP